MPEGWLLALDQRVREAKRTTFAETRRGMKVLRERARNAVTAAVNLSAKQWRRARKIGPYLDHRRRKLEDARKRAVTYRAEWAIEREVARLATGSHPLIVGPWLSEVGYEVLYWIPFVRWVQATYHVDPERLIVATRGGAAVWYSDITRRSVELFDLLPPAAYAERNARRAEQGGGSGRSRISTRRLPRRCGIAPAPATHGCSIRR
jgi:hypothetical protein